MAQLYRLNDYSRSQFHGMETPRSRLRGLYDPLRTYEQAVVDLNRFRQARNPVQLPADVEREFSE